MERRYWGKRAVSLVLALELLLSPVAMARAADPGRFVALPETPVGEEVQVQIQPDGTPGRSDQAQAKVLEGDPLPFNRVQIGSNLSVLTEISSVYDYDLWETINSYYFRLNDADDLLNVEVSSDETALLGSLWDNLQFQMAKDTGVKAGEDSRYTYLPALLDARVPDRKFAGYYLVTADAYGNVDEAVRPLGQEGQETFLTEEPDGIYWENEDFTSLQGGQLVRLQSAYQTVVGDTENEFNNNYLPLAAWYEPSDEAKLTALGVTVHGTVVENTVLTKVYTQDPLAQAEPETVTLTDFAAAPEGNKTGAEFEAQEMWIQVGSDQTSLDLHFQTYEPYYSYTKDGEPQEGALCPVSVAYSLDGGASRVLPLTRGDDLTCQFLPRPKQFESWLRGANTQEDKARGDWQVTGIPLTGSGNASPREVEIVLTVTAPDGVTQKTYTIHVQRRQSVTGKGTLGWGNTPFGMIERDNSDKWNDEVTKALAKERFLANGLRFSDVATRPTGSENQNGGVYHRWPYTNCWPGRVANPDLDATAIVAYQDMKFQDPGVTFTDSFGREVDLDNALYTGTVKRTIELKTPQNGTLSAASWSLADALTRTCWYQVENGRSSLTADANKASQTLTSLNQEVDLRGLPVLPGIYEIQYDYTDPCSDDTTPESGARPTYTDTVTRRMVVLPIPGDVDMDGAVTSADAYALRNNLASWRSSSEERVWLAVGRVFDLNGNGTLEEDDYKAILNGYQPELLRSGPISDYFYLPLPTGGTGYQRKTWEQVENTGSGTLSLEFLGVEKGTGNGEFTVDPHGPFDTKTEGDGSLSPVALRDQVTGEDNSVFWMGVKLTDSPLEGEDIENFTLSLTYDSRYVEPAMVYTAQDKASYEQQAGSGSFEGWGYTLRKYNLRGDTADSRVIWKGTLSGYDETGSTSQRSYQTHYSKVVGELEQDRGTSSLRELVVTLRYQENGAAHARVGDGYLLALPFKLKSQPPKDSSSSARLIELGAGMRELTLVTTQPQNGLLAALFGGSRAAGAEVTSAFSAQDSIYGGSTQNLRDGLSYDTDSGKVPIGKDNTARTVLAQATYGERYQVNNVGRGNAVGVIQGFPPGLVYNTGAHSVSGTPLVPGTYQFELNEILYEITVNPKTIHYRPQNADSYYGEQEYRGSVAERENAPGLRNFAFEYNARDLCADDRTYARDVLGLNLGDGSRDEWRDGKELLNILNRSVTNPYNDKKTYDYTYTAPGFTAFRDTAGNPVEAGTVVGDYTINTTINASSTCYTLEQERTASLTVVRRPVYVDHIIASAEDSGLSIYNDERVSFSGRVLYDKAPTTQIALTLPALEADGTYNSRPLTGSAKVGDDQVAVTYNGQFLHDLTKGDTNTTFQLNDQQEVRQVQAQRVTLRTQVNVSGTILQLQSGNYTLVDNNVRHRDGEDDIKGIVILRGVAEMEMTDFPSELGRENYYGARVENPEALMVRAVLGEGSSSTLVGKYAYNSPDLFPLLIHYNWVTPEEYEEGSKPENANSLVGTGVDADGKDTRPYGFSREVDPENRRAGGYRDNYLYPDMNGWRICACVSKYVGDEDTSQGAQYIKCYSEPITIRPRTLTLTARSAQRFYGEELGEGLPDFTFRVSQLAGKDTAGVTRGTSAELKMVFDRLDAELEGYGVAQRHKLPQFRMVDDQGTPVTATTPIVVGRTYRILISGAESPCYDIQYTVQEGETTSTSPAEGSAPLVIQPRPIIVKAVRGNGEGGSFTNIYADTKNLVVAKDPVTGSFLEAAGDKVDFILPQYDPVRGTTSYYTATSDGNMYTDYGCSFPAGTDRETEALVPGDDVQVRYQVRFLPDPECYTWTEFTQGFFDNDAIAESSEGYLNKKVQVEKMELVGADSGNYVMVFADDVSFMDRVPSSAMDNTVSAPANNDQAVNKPYYVSGEGRVYLRPIQNIVITSLGQMTYTYGDQFAPSEPGTSGNAMTVRVEYDRTYDNDPDNNFNAEDVVYRQLRVDEETGERISTFAARGFAIYYVKPGQTRSEAEALAQTVTSGDIMAPGTHHGATLFVTGRRNASNPLVYSQYAPTQAEEPIRVGKATLTLTAADAHKFYGEENPTGDYTFTFDTRELVQVDQDALRALSGGTLAREGTQSDLAQLDPGADFTGLRFVTNATVRSTVGTNGKWGEYDLTLTAANPTTVLSNYNVVTRDASLYVYPRPVRVTGINSSANDPVYTIFNDPTTFTYRTEFSTAQRSGLQPRVEVACGTATPVYPVSAGNSGDGKPHDLPITTSLGLLSGDDLIFQARVDFPNSGWSLTGADVSLGVRVSELGLLNTAVTRNYTLLTRSGESFGELDQTTGDGAVWGSAKLRTIRSISITNPPNKLEYTYGEPLDLTGLRVLVEYAQLDQETGSVERVTVDYLGPEQFKSMGLYVNYWTPGEALPTSNEQRRSLPDVYWTAATGDHLTIAPTHETQRYLAAPGQVPKARPFAANGKYLVVSGFQKAVSADTQIAATPVILGERIASGDYVGTPTPIKVNPLKLRYTLRAQDKTYDGDARAAGSLTLTNLYGSGSSADVVYVPFGASYESSSMDHSNFGAFKTNVTDGRVTFTTGTYLPNGEVPLAENGRTEWADNYVWGRGLTFTFANPNVHYVDDSGILGVGSQEQADYWSASQSFEDVTTGWDKYKAVTAMPVEVTNMVLAGPDAANYTWDWDSAWNWDANNGHQVRETSVGMTTRSATVDGQAAAPFATIQKANRSPIQELNGYSGAFARLVVDRNTNVVRLLLDQPLAALADNNNAGRTDEFRDELHFEYALLYAQTDADGVPTGLLANWAGVDGKKAYQDTTFFGGETVTPTATDAAYRPDLARLPKAEAQNENTVYNGQLYQWAELDTGVVEVGGRTFREDSGFVLNPDAYPGGAVLTDENGNEVKAEDAYWYYTLYTTDRVNLPRDTVFYPIVRLSETHNYHASGNLSGDGKVTAALLDAAQKALAAWEADQTEEKLAAAQEASRAVLAAADSMEAAAQAAARAQMDFDAELGENSQWPEEQPVAQIGPASAIKTLTQRLDLTSASTERSLDRTDNTDYLVELLEAVWFTDTLIYEDEKHLSAAVYNHPTRYYGYFWDADKTAKVEFNETALNFTEEIVVPVRVKLEDGSTVETTMTVNTFDETLGGRVAKLYVQTTNDTGRQVRMIQILPTVLYVRLGDEPYQLTWAAIPEKPSNRRFRWTSSDPSVATVDENGLVTFRGVGRCTITLTTDNGKSSSIRVTVSEPLPLTRQPESLFDFLHNEAWMELDEEENFYPELPMTRAQAVELLDLFLNPNANWTATAELPYLDVTGEEKYADALRRMTGAGVVVGLPGSAFGGSQLITRAEFVTMVTRMLRLDTPDTKGQVHQFADAGAEDTWAYRYIDALGKTGIIQGAGGGNFLPGRELTRQEAAAILARLLTVKLDESLPGLKIPADMTPENWSYAYVLQAVNTIVFPEPTVTPPTDD